MKSAGQRALIAFRQNRADHSALLRQMSEPRRQRCPFLPAAPTALHGCPRHRACVTPPLALRAWKTEARRLAPVAFVFNAQRRSPRRAVPSTAPPPQPQSSSSTVAQHPQRTQPPSPLLLKHAPAPTLPFLRSIAQVIRRQAATAKLA